MGASKISTSLIFLSCLLIASSPATTAFNITAILENYPNLSTFSDLLINADLVKEINSQTTITLLAIPNDQIGDLAGKPVDITKTILKTHVILDYYDLLKLQNLNKPTIMTTLYQKTGVATYGQGFLNVSKNSNGQIIFASEAKGAPRDVHLLGTVTQHPFNYSILSVSHSIVTPGVEGTTLAPPPHATAPAPAKKGAAPTPSSKAPEAPAPSDDASPPSDAPSDASPPADAPKSDAPASDAPAADVADAKSPKSASFKHTVSSSFGLLVVLASFLAAY